MAQELIRAGRHQATITGASRTEDDSGITYVEVVFHTTEGLDHRWRITIDPSDSKGLPYRKQELLQLGWNGTDLDTLPEQLIGKQIAFGITHENTKDGKRQWAKTFISNTQPVQTKEPTKASTAKLLRALTAVGEPVRNSAPAAISPMAAKAAAAAAARKATKAEAAEAEDDSF